VIALLARRFFPDPRLNFAREQFAKLGKLDLPSQKKKDVLHRLPTAYKPLLRSWLEGETTHSGDAAAFRSIHLKGGDFSMESRRRMSSWRKEASKPLDGGGGGGPVTKRGPGKAGEEELARQKETLGIVAGNSTPYTMRGYNEKPLSGLQRPAAHIGG